jgi:dihydroflavonol-4-reductase
MATLLRRRPPVVIGVPRPVIGLAALGAERVGRLSGTVPMFHRDKTRELRCPAWTCSPERAVAGLGFEPTISLPTGLATGVAATPLR